MALEQQTDIENFDYKQDFSSFLARTQGEAYTSKPYGKGEELLLLKMTEI